VNKKSIEKIAKAAASDCIKKADFDIAEMLKSVFSGGMDLKQLMPYMGMAMPLFKGVGSAAGLPGIAGLLDLVQGGKNISTLTAGGGNTQPVNTNTQQPRTGPQPGTMTSPTPAPQQPRPPIAVPPPPAPPPPPTPPPAAPRMFGNADISEANKPLPPKPPGAPKRRMWGNAEIG